MLLILSKNLLAYYTVYLINISLQKCLDILKLPLCLGVPRQATSLLINKRFDMLLKPYYSLLVCYTKKINSNLITDVLRFDRAHTVSGCSSPSNFTLN